MGLLSQRNVEEIMINPDGAVWIESAGQLRKSDVHLGSHQREILARRIASQLNIDLAPLLSGSIGEARVQMVMPPLVRAPAFAFRLPGRSIFTLDDFRMTAAQRGFLDTAIGQSRSILISGATSSGKTSFANALLTLPAFANARLVTIEDTPELRPCSSDVVSLISSDEASPRALVRVALRLRPDRLILGEVRGGEAYDLLQALNTGHGGSLTTIHANSPEDALGRLLDLAREAVPGLSASAISRARFLVIQLGRLQGKRRLMSMVDCSNDTNPENTTHV
jgi:type IV secretion system protein VirB11